MKSETWIAPSIPTDIPHGDMPGDKVDIREEHIQKAQLLIPHLLKPLQEMMKANMHGRAVVTVCGGSGVGKSEIASLLAFYLGDLGISCYTLSGDNYPRRVPVQNDAERLRIFRTAGLKGLVCSGCYTPEMRGQLHAFWETGSDADPGLAVTYPWMEIYQRDGRSGLAGYLGSDCEIDFLEVSDLLSAFKLGAPELYLKRMGRAETDLWYEKTDMHGISVLIVEWTHGNSDHFRGVDLPILLNSTPEETLAHRRARGRDKGTDSPFTTMVLELEQKMLGTQACKARFILSKAGELMEYSEYRRSVL